MYKACLEYDAIFSTSTFLVDYGFRAVNKPPKVCIQMTNEKKVDIATIIKVEIKTN